MRILAQSFGYESQPGTVVCLKPGSIGTDLVLGSGKKLSVYFTLHAVCLCSGNMGNVRLSFLPSSVCLISVLLSCAAIFYFDSLDPVKIFSCMNI